MNTLFQDSLRVLESKFHKAAGGAKTYIHNGLLLEIVAARHVDRGQLDASVPVWCDANVLCPGSALQLKTQESTAGVRLLGCLHFAWFFKETMFVAKDTKVLITLKCRCSDEDKALGTVIVSISQLVLGEARDFPLTLISGGDDEPNTDNAEGFVGSVTVRVYTPGGAGATSAVVQANQLSQKNLNKAARSDLKVADSDHASAARSALGNVQVVVWQGKNINTSCPCYITLDIPDVKGGGVGGTRKNYPQRCRLPTQQNPHNPIFDYIANFYLFSLQGNIVLELWEENVARDIKLGQVIIPISWLTDNLTLPELLLKSTSEHQNISGWFEVFPCTKPSRYNRGGQYYLPAIKGIPSSTGYGMSYPSTPIGFIKLDISLNLREPVFQAILRDPWSYKPEKEEVDDDEDAGLSSILVTGYALLRIFKLLKNPPFFETVFEILNWKAPFPLCVAVLYTVSYTALLAKPWQYPLFIFLTTLMIGKAAGNKQRFADFRAFSNVSAHDDGDSKHTKKGDLAVVGGVGGVGVVVGVPSEDHNRGQIASMGDGGDRSVVTMTGNTERGIQDPREIQKQQEFVVGGGVEAQSKTLSPTPSPSPSQSQSQPQSQSQSQSHIQGKKKEKDGGSSSITEQYKHMKREALHMEKSVLSVCSRLERYSNLLCWGDPILSGITALIVLGLAFLAATTLLILTPNQTLFFFCLSLFMPKEIQEFVLRTLTERASKFVSWLLHRRKKTSACSNKNEQEPENGRGESEVLNTEDRAQMSHGEEKTKKLSYTRWLKLQARRWLRMVPDDLDLLHKQISAASFISREQEFERLPTKTKVYAVEDEKYSSVSANVNTNSAGNHDWSTGLGAQDDAALFAELWVQATTLDARSHFATPTARAVKRDPSGLVGEGDDATISSLSKRELLEKHEPGLPNPNERGAVGEDETTSIFLSTIYNSSTSAPVPTSSSPQTSAAAYGASKRLAMTPRPIGDVYRERRRSHFLLEEQISLQKRTEDERSQAVLALLRMSPQPFEQQKQQQQQQQQQQQRALGIANGQESCERARGGEAVELRLQQVPPLSYYISTRHAIETFSRHRFFSGLSGGVQGNAGSGSSTNHAEKLSRAAAAAVAATATLNPARLGPLRSEFKKTFTLRVTVLAARGLRVKSAQKVTGYLTIMAQKIYADLSVMPHSSCGVYCRTGGQPRAPNVVFREEFIFKKIGPNSQALMVVLSMKSAMDQSKISLVHLGHCVAQLDALQFALGVGEGAHVGWYPLYGRSGQRLANSALQLSLELVVN